MSGTEHIAIAECAHPYDSCECLDTHGVPGVNATLTGQVFTDGRAWRIESSIPFVKKTFDIRDWRIKRPVNSTECDPGTLTPPTPPTLPPAPTPTPPHGPSKGKPPSPPYG